MQSEEEDMKKTTLKPILMEDIKDYRQPSAYQQKDRQFPLFHIPHRKYGKVYKHHQAPPHLEQGL